MLEKEVAKKIKCFVCGEGVTFEDIVVVSLNEEDMVCVCRNHSSRGLANYPYSSGITSPVNHKIKNR